MTTLRLSEAIKLGSMLRPQAFWENFTAIGSCAIGAGLEAVGKRWDYATSIWPWLNAPQACPECGVEHERGGWVITHLNDIHHWTRERIADWVATVEPAEVEATVESTVLAEVLCPAS